jgi:site-specific recombinase XerD
MPPGAINDLFARLGARAGLARQVSPHMCRHAYGSNLVDAGATLDEVQELLRHAQPSSSAVYLHPSAQRVRAAVDRVPSPRLGEEGQR